MKKPFITFIAGLFLIFASLAVTAAEMPTQIATMPQMSTILQKLQAKGYSIIREIKFEKGAFEAKAINAQGNEIDIRINPQTGEMFQPTANPARLNMLEVVKKVEAAGYHNIYKIKSDDDKYDVKALDNNGKSVEVEVNAITGTISKEWF
jgi:hypothetical protein